MYVNLLPDTFLRRLMLRRQASRWGLTALLTLVVTGGFVAAKYCGVASARKRQSMTALRSKDLHAIKADTGRLLEDAKTIESSIESLKQAQPEDRTLALLGIASRTAKKLDGKVHLKQLTTQRAPVNTPSQNSPQNPVQPGKKPAPAAAAIHAPNDFLLEGDADDATAIAVFIEALRETGLFARVDLTATNEATGGNTAARHFRVDCKF